MLKQLQILNYALIDSADISFDNGFSVITGETGAGKSIMLGALALILGQRSDTSAMRDKEEKCVVEACFNLEGYGLEPLFVAEDVDFDNETVIRREILPSGKSRAFVNDTPVTLNFLKELSQKLIDIHSQHQNLLLGDFNFQLMVVDTVAGNAHLKSDYRKGFDQLKQIKKERSRLLEMYEKQQSDKDYWSFQANQLREAAMQPGEQAELEQELEQLTHVEEIKAALSSANLLMAEGEYPILDGIHQVQGELSRISKYLPGGDELWSRLEIINIELKDIAREIGERSAGIEFEPQRARYVQDRLDTIYSLQQKHHVDSVDALLSLLSDLDEKLTRLESFDEEIALLDNAIAAQQAIVETLAEKLSDSRKAVFESIQHSIEQQLHQLGMPHARFRISHSPSEAFRDDGFDEIQFLFTANKNGELADIPKVASGGEMSRVMLCIKSLLSSAKGLPTIIFDEIDTGVSGEIADKMGRIMQQMGLNIQVISITHLPQIAGKGANHYKVYKTDTDHQTISAIRQLNDEDRVLEIAGMLSGAELSEAALSNARDLMAK
ncbi:DNA repair protein RecN [Alkaliflexus imshenetskii]|uniref:DNA repair protein RecN n=1 Tax=Alkaliflexus imshenetskii TaxID=286730 RepID=UPI00047DBE35|nr:DNA repair protein RecN [Alkaliflexus imshenetskii]